MGKRVMLCANRDFVLYNFRFELLQRLLDEGYEVMICLPYGPKVDLMTAIGCVFIPLEVEGRGTNPFKDARLLHAYRRIFKKYKPDMVLTYTTKVCIYAGIVAGRMKIPYLENISGLGTAVETKNILQPLMIALYRMAVKRAQAVFFQNEANEQFFADHGIACRKRIRIPGSGVNLERWKLLDYPRGEKTHFLFVARIIREKGIEQYLYAAEKIKKKHPETVFHICGPCDGNYAEILVEKQEAGIIEYHGMVQDTGEFLKAASCLVHPSYYPEGISNVLLEACASGRPIITTDRPGCREVVEDGVNGYRIPCRDSEALVEAIEKFLGLSWDERREMGVQARRKVEREFDREIVIGKYMEEISNI